MKFILAQKIGMSQIFKETGEVVPVTIIEAGPVKITQIKKNEKDGYEAIQVGFGHKNKLAKPQKGHLHGLENFRWLREFIVPSENNKEKEWKRGDKISVEIFQENDLVVVQGTSKGKGFQGVVKRYGFKGSPASHGTKDKLRAPGSIGATTPQRVIPGMRMAGRMGNDTITLKKVRVVKVDPKNNRLYLQGALPGRRGSLLKISA